MSTPRLVLAAARAVCDQSPTPKGMRHRSPCCPSPSGDRHPTAAPHPAPSPQLLLAGPMCIPWGMFNPEPQRQEGQCPDLSFPRGKLRHGRFNSFSTVLCCRAELGTRQQVPNHQLIFSLSVSTESTTQEGCSSWSSFKQLEANGPQQLVGKWAGARLLTPAHGRIGWSYLPRPSRAGPWSGGDAPSAKAFSSLKVQQEGTCRNRLSQSRWGLSISGGFRSRWGWMGFLLCICPGGENYLSPSPPLPTRGTP